MLKRISFVILVLLFSSCTTYPTVQPQVNSFIVAGKVEHALKVMDTHGQAYGKNSELLYLLDRGLVLHLAKKYKESIRAFEKAKRKFDELITVSVSKELGTWVVNDYSAPYRGEDFERVLINVFQALNFVALGEINEALVEARDVNSQLSIINQQYKADQKNVYRDDAFARLLMGVLYEANQTAMDNNDAFIEYANAVKIYEGDYRFNYELIMPTLLKENILSMSEFMGRQEVSKYKKKFGNISYPSLTEKKKKSEVFVIQYNGYAPIKIQNEIPIPLPGGIVKFAFPKYHQRVYSFASSRVIAVNGSNSFQVESELVQDIGAIALKNLERRKTRLIAKALVRPIGKYMLSKTLEKAARDKWGNKGGDATLLATQLWNFASETADLRSWQTLPDQIRMARLILPAGTYDLTLENLDKKKVKLGVSDLGKVQLTPGQKKFIIIRTAR